MKDMKKTKDRRLVLLDALLRYADLTGNIHPHFYKDEMLKMLNVSEHNFDIMQGQLGDRYCRMVDRFEVRSRYAIDVISCLELRDQILKAGSKERRIHDGFRIKLLSTLIGAFVVILLYQMR